MVVVHEDVTEQKVAEDKLRESERHHRHLSEHNRLLIREVQHRVGNNLAGLLALVQIMRYRTDGIDAFAQAIERRLGGMVHVHKMLTGTGWNSLDLAALITSTLQTLRDTAFCVCDERIEGPDVEIVATQVLPLTLILIEWFTNSCKYGAHSVPTGCLRLNWMIEADEPTARLRLTWRESGGPPILSPGNPSVGTDLVTTFAKKELGGMAKLSFPREGVYHELIFPLNPPSASERGILLDSAYLASLVP